MSDSIWTGSGAGSSMSCDDWTSYSSAKTGRTFGTNNTTYAFPVWNAGSNHCGYYHAILCICK